jgi:uncharacterized protein YndB with AHSA1/START domain
MDNRSATDTADREISATRLFDAPPELVWKVWTDPRHIGRWWGPRGFTTTTYRMDVRPGGAWRFVMHGPDGVDYENNITFLEVVEPQRLVYEHGGGGEVEPVSFRVTVTLEPEGTRTRLNMRMVFPTKEARDFTADKYGAVEGLHQTLGRLEEKLGAIAAGSDDVEGPASDRELVVSREIDAPRAAVWRAWTDPAQVKRWWGPHGMTTPVCEIDLRPGGAFRTVMRDAAGTDHPCKGRYRGVVEPERLVFDNAALDERGDVAFEILATVTLDDQGGGRTKVTARVHHKSVAERENHERMGFFDGWGQTLERLAAHTAGLDPARQQFEIVRTFDAPRDLVWRAWTEREHLMQWFGPTGVTMPTATLDLRPGGRFHFSMRSPDGSELWGRFVFREIVPPERLAWAHAFSDKEGGLGRTPFGGEWPLELLTTVTFTEEAGRTTVTMRWSPLGPTDAERRAFDAAHDDMRTGWGGTFDRLEAHLASAKD